MILFFGSFFLSLAFLLTQAGAQLNAGGTTAPPNAIPGPEQRNLTLDEYHGRVLEGCYFVGHHYAPPLLYANGTQIRLAAANFTDCQQMCNNYEGCAYFSFWEALNNPQRCVLSGAEALFVHTWAEGATSGPKVCPKEQLGCTEMPGEDFPGQTIADSTRAWPSHRVPNKMECWPTNWTTREFLDCGEPRVVKDSSSGFPGHCDNLWQVSVVPQNETCESLCRRNVMCALSVVRKEGGERGPKKCYHGYATSGTNCYTKRDASSVLVSAHRFFRGHVRVLKNTTGSQIMGLRNSFGPYWFINVSAAIDACKGSCYTNLKCQYWQYIQSSGCWVEDSTARLPAVPTTQVWHPGPDVVLAGEYIQHFCGNFTVPKADEILYPVDAPEDPTLSGSFFVSGRNGKFHNLTQNQKVLLNLMYSKEIAVAIGAHRHQVQDKMGSNRRVDFTPLKLAGAITMKVDYTIELDKIPRQYAESRLKSPEFKETLVNVTANVWETREADVHIFFKKPRGLQLLQVDDDTPIPVFIWIILISFAVVGLIVVIVGYYTGLEDGENDDDYADPFTHVQKQKPRGKGEEENRDYLPVGRFVDQVSEHYYVTGEKKNENLKYAKEGNALTSALKLGARTVHRHTRQAFGIDNDAAANGAGSSDDPARTIRQAHRNFSSQ